MNFQITLEEKLEVLKKLYEDEQDDEMRKIILYQMIILPYLLYERCINKKGSENDSEPFLSDVVSLPAEFASLLALPSF